MADTRIRTYLPHEIRSDLSIISAALQIAERRLADDPEVQTVLRSATERVHRLAQALNDSQLADSESAPETPPL